MDKGYEEFFGDLCYLYTRRDRPLPASIVEGDSEQLAHQLLENLTEFLVVSPRVFGPQRAAYAITHSYGLGVASRSLGQIGEDTCMRKADGTAIGRERVRQLRNKGMRHLRSESSMGLATILTPDEAAVFPNLEK
ncbi:MAG: hypothetical protein OXR66_09635 [Candidatus Woesearchaeota archaeon]|nr:hypothetical protein [Candidatus Woesearchaeota archaeon]